MDKQELKAILGKHLKWLRGEDGGERANLFGANPVSYTHLDVYKRQASSPVTVWPRVSNRSCWQTQSPYNFENEDEQRACELARKER